MDNLIISILIYVALGYSVFELFPGWDFLGRMSLVNLLIMIDAGLAYSLPKFL